MAKTIEMLRAAVKLCEEVPEAETISMKVENARDLVGAIDRLAGALRGLLSVEAVDPGHVHTLAMQNDARAALAEFESASPGKETP